MDKASFYQCFDESFIWTEDSLCQLTDVLRQYPYFSAARLLYLKNLKKLGRNDFSEELQRWSVGVNDRKALYLQLEAQELLVGSQEDYEVETSPQDFALIDDFLSQQAVSKDREEPDDSFLYPSMVTSDYLLWREKTEDLECDMSDSSEARLEHQDLIDAFIQKEEDRKTQNEVLEDTEEDIVSPLVTTASFSETLSRIYIKQKRYDKALQIIKNLSLKYPEKNVYFADQIRFLEKLIINTKK